MAESPPISRTRRPAAEQGLASSRIAVRGANPGLAGRLHQAVRAAGGNQAVARCSGVPLATVNNYVRGRNGMKIGPLSALAVACNVSLEWLIAGGDAAATGLLAGLDFPVAGVARPSGLAEAQADASPAGRINGIDVRILAKAIEIVAAIAGAADFQANPKGLARRIATTYAVLIKPEASRD